jgi:hypothetical protein
MRKNQKIVAVAAVVHYDPDLTYFGFEVLSRHLFLFSLYDNMLKEIDRTTSNSLQSFARPFHRSTRSDFLSLLSC